MLALIQKYKWRLFAIILLGGIAALVERLFSVREHSQDAVILAAAARSGVEPALIKAVVWRESWFDPKAKGTSGEIGLMQIREPTARDWASAERIHFFHHFQIYDPGRNTSCGAWYLRRLLTRYRHTDRPMTYALAAYNAGPTHVARWSKGAAATNAVELLRQMDYPGTRRYVQSVTERYEYYRSRFPPGSASRN